MDIVAYLLAFCMDNKDKPRKGSHQKSMGRAETIFGQNNMVYVEHSPTSFKRCPPKLHLVSSYLLP
jgi:hypothetical protein